MTEAGRERVGALLCGVNYTERRSGEMLARGAPGSQSNNSEGPRVRAKLYNLSGGGNNRAGDFDRMQTQRS